MRKFVYICLIVVLLCGCGKKSSLSDETSENIITSIPEATEEFSEVPEESSESEISVDSSSSEESLEEDSLEKESAEESIVDPEEDYLIWDVSATPGLRFDELLASGGFSDETMTEAETLYSRLPDEALSCYFPMEGYIISMPYKIPRYEEPGLAEILDQSLTRVQELMEESGTGMSLHEVLTRASIVQIEGSLGTRGDIDKMVPEVMPHIASVIENRLSSGTPLQMDVTRWYAEDLIEQYGADPSYEDLYNTYLTAALPLGPIASPSEEAILAVLYPDESDDFFFVYDEEGNYLFAETYEEHLENCHTAGLW